MGGGTGLVAGISSECSFVYSRGLLARIVLLRKFHLEDLFDGFRRQGIVSNSAADDPLGRSGPKQELEGHSQGRGQTEPVLTRSRDFVRTSSIMTFSSQPMDEFSKYLPASASATADGHHAQKPLMGAGTYSRRRQWRDLLPKRNSHHRFAKVCASQCGIDRLADSRVAFDVLNGPGLRIPEHL